MIDELRNTDDYIEELENELNELRLGHNQLSSELGAVYGSRAYRLGSLGRAAYRDPIRVAKKIARVAKNTRRLSPLAFRHHRAATPVNSTLLDNAYRKWQQEFEPSAKELEVQKEKAKQLPKQPLFSIITPVFKPPEKVLIELIESMLCQTYPNFELCLGEFSGEESTRAILTEYAAKDRRIKVKFFDSNDGISDNSNLCLELATGDYVGLLDHDDTLSPDALYENVVMINKKDYDFIYSDKDKIEENGRRFDPMFKPDWSPEIMLTANYLTHFNVFKMSILKKIGEWDRTTDGAQDWDLFFRLIAASKHVGHIPKILYHWRVIATSTAMSISTKPYALQGQKNAIGKYARSLGIRQPTVIHSKEGALSLEWGQAGADKKVHCIVFTDDEGVGKAQGLARTLKKTLPRGSGITIYNSQSVDTKLNEIISKQKTKADALLFISAQVTSVSRGKWVKELLGWLTVPGVGIVAPQIYSKYGVFLDSGRVIGLGSSATPLFAGENYIPGIFGYREWSRNVTMPPMSCFVINTSALKNESISQEGIQGIREIVLKSIKSGARTVVTPFDSVVINAAAIYEPTFSSSNRKLLEATVPGLKDPFFSTNLSANVKFPVFTTKEEDVKRVKIIAGYLDRPVEYDPAVSAKHETFGQEVLPLIGYKQDAYILSGSVDYLPEDVVNSQKITDSTAPIGKIESALWIVPYFTTLYAGLKNIFSLAAEMTEKEGTKHTFYVTTQADVQVVKDLVTASFPSLSSAEFLDAEHYQAAKDANSYTIGVCTLWTTAYDLLKNNNVKRKLYIIQDDERSFYLRGSIYGLVNATYKFGFWGLAGTKALADWYGNKDGGQKNTVVIGSDLDLQTYLKKSSSPSKPKNSLPRVLFYSRPDAPRNAFELGLVALNKLASNLNGKVEIVLAGADFDLGQYPGAHPAIHVAGKVPYSSLAEFYSSFDAALFLMFSEHPGVFALEMMAAGCPVVVNDHDNDSWRELYVDGKTCVLSDPTASSIASSIQTLLTDDALRKTVLKNGRQLAEKFASGNHDVEVRNVLKLIKK